MDERPVVGQKFPVVQLKQLVEVATPEYVPAAQFVQALAVKAEYAPAAQIPVAEESPVTPQ